MLYINVNSLRNQFEPLSEVLVKRFLDILIIQETKLDDTFLDGHFAAPGFKLYVKSSIGGIMMHVKNNFVQFRYRELQISEWSSGHVEVMKISVTLNKEKLVIISAYKQPKVKDRDIIGILESVVDI